MVSFYQIKSLITVQLTEKTDEISHMEQFLSSILNLKLPVLHALSNICPVDNLDAVTKLFIKDFLFVCLMLFIVLLCNGCVKIYKVMQRKHRRYCKTILMRLRKCTLQIIMLGYTIWATFALSMIHCRKINDKRVLYVDGELICYSWWQRLNMFFLVFWIIPFPIALWLTSKLLKQLVITVTEFFVCVFIPWCTIYFLIKTKYVKPLSTMTKYQT